MLSANLFIAGVGGRSPRRSAVPRPEQWRRTRRRAVFEFADDAPGDITDGVDRPNHFLRSDEDVVEQAFKLGRNARIDQRRVSLL